MQHLTYGTPVIYKGEGDDPITPQITELQFDFKAPIPNMFLTNASMIVAEFYSIDEYHDHFTRFFTGAVMFTVEQLKAVSKSGCLELPILAFTYKDKENNLPPETRGQVRIGWSD